MSIEMFTEANSWKEGKGQLCTLLMRMLSEQQRSHMDDSERKNVETIAACAHISGVLIHSDFGWSEMIQLIDAIWWIP